MSWREATSFGRIKFTHPIILSLYTKALSYAATIPILKYAFQVISDGGTTATPILVMSNGTVWKAFGAAMTTTVSLT